ncbi:thioredoxin family protein [Alkalihalobacillus hwajinpoensis]|uniref:thioredoxin family protein n=1 Tax=Guptibacillus hwajinpoensis TaxID=208199 RepID=UPI0018848F68|nr:thioredoxin family protein [Pseudalkalibacillus hwajinpoensis]MBF0707309.1 thioredoxin family protein [Pseudalkalibacillus hwajinpoensis]
MNLTNWFDQGMTMQQYIHSMDEHKDDLLTIYNHFELEKSNLEFLHSLQSEKLRALVITADWCGDAMVNLPIFMRMADEALIESKYFIRDNYLELMDLYLTNGTARSIPIIVLIDSNGNEVGRWGPRAPEVQAYVDQAKQALPPKGDPNFKKAFLSFISETTERFTTDHDMWTYIKDDMLAMLSQSVTVTK